MDKIAVLDAAKKCAEWLLSNQITNRIDANKGRFLSYYDLSLKEKNAFAYTTSWDTGCALNGLLALYKRTGEQRYLDAAELAGHYIMSLQIMDPRDKKFYGAIRECTPQSVEFCPRDATSGAWALVWLYETTGNQEYLDRAVLFGEWMMEYGMFEGWPRWAVMTDGQDHFYAKGSFQSGVGLFFHDLFMQTHDPRYIAKGMRPIAETYIRDFLRDDGSIILTREIMSNKLFIEGADPKGRPMEFDMHCYNDDFGCAMLLRAADIFDDPKYDDAALRFAHYLARVQDPDGDFGKGLAPSAMPQALIYYHDLGEKFNDAALLAARDRTLDALLKFQFKDLGDAKIDGAFPAEGHKGQNICNMRASMYALTALLHVESDIEGVWLGRANKKFCDLLHYVSQAPLKFKW